MSSSQSILTLHARALDVPMKKPFGIAGGAQVEAKNVIVELRVAGEVGGWGEGAPFPAFNGETQAQVLEALEAARAETGAALVLITHDPSLAERCDRTVRLTDGRIVDDGLAVRAERVRVAGD